MSAKPFKPETDSEPAAEAASPGKVSLWRRLLSKRWLALLMVSSLVIHGLLVMCWPRAGRSNIKFPSEIELGEFQFVNHENSARLSKARFKLHVSLLFGTETLGGIRLNDKKFLVQQGIEELLRQSHAADFDDPTLAELKRQIQEKVNEAVEMRIVEEVIITHLETENRAQSKSAVASFQQEAEAAEAARASRIFPEFRETKPENQQTHPAETNAEEDSAG